MRILIVGAGGFIGKNLASRLGVAGHRIVCGGRNPNELRRRFFGYEIQQCDLSLDAAEDWAARLIGIDVVINAAGIIRDVGENSFERVHVTGPCALFDACAKAGIAQVIQISALGADRSAWSRFHLSKILADDYLCRLADIHGATGWIVLRPAVVIGRGGHSTALFTALAALPRPVRIGPGTWPVPAIHIDDLANAVALIVARRQPLPLRVDLIGPGLLTTDALTQVLRDWLGLPRAPFLTIPDIALRGFAAIGDRLNLGMLSVETLAMLRLGHYGETEQLPDAFGWRARSVAEALAASPATGGDVAFARLFFLKPVLRIGLGVLWASTGIISAFIHPVTRSAAMLAGLDLYGWTAAATVYAGAALDLMLGVALLLALRPAVVGVMQIGVMLLFTGLATIAVPDDWFDPLGPLTKNLAVLLATLVMIVLETKR